MRKSIFLRLRHNCGQMRVLFHFFYYMFSLKARTLALIVLSTLTVQIVSPVVLNTYALNTLYYVDATLGSDANTGGIGDPWQTLTHVSSQTFSA